MRKDLTEEIKKQAQRSMELEEASGLPPDDTKEIMQHVDEAERRKGATQQEPDKEDREEHMRMRYLIAIVFLFASLAVMCFCFEPVEYQEDTKEVQSERVTTVTVIGKDDTSGQDDQSQTEEEKLDTEEIQEESFDWELAVFGEKKLQVTSGTIAVNGLTSAQKEAIQFRESDYVRQLAGFLKEKNMDSDEVHFQEKADISAETAVAYVAELNKDPEILISVFYPDCPGNYLFLLEEREEEVKEEEAASATELPSAVWEPQNVPATEQKQTEPAYDATRLSVRGIPNTLLNYLDNRYELQYSLYDYLYRNGYRDVTAAEVSDYSIDGETKEAEIVFTLSNGASLQGTYDKERNSYVYY